jgi:tight adherence protein B
VSGAALALALALLVVPDTSRRRARVRRAAVPRRPPLLACVLFAVCALPVLMPPALVVAAALVGVTIGRRFAQRNRDRRRTREAAAMLGALDVLVGELRVGAHPAAAFGVAANEVDGATAAGLRSVAARARMGADVADGIRSVARESALPAQWERLAVCWLLAQGYGLGIATMLQAAQRDLAQRQRFTARVSAGMAGARATAAVLAALPVIGIALGQLIGADPVRFLLSRGPGGWLLVIGVAFACAGLLWSDRITARVMK